LHKFPRKMNNTSIQDINIADAKAVIQSYSIEDDLVLFDNIEDIHIPNNPYRVNCYVLGLCLRGKAQYSVDTEERLINTYDTIVIHNRQVIDSYMVSPNFKCIFLFISTNFFNEVVKGIHDLVSLFLFTRNHPIISLHAEEVELLEEYYAILKKKVGDKNNYFRKDLVRSLLLAMIYDITNIIYQQQQTSNKNQTRAEAIFSKFLPLLEVNYKRERRVSWYAEQLCITSKYLSETIKQVSRRTPNEWINNYVVLEARVLLKNSTMSIKEIAQNLNFPNQSFLGKYFKDHVGISPSEYRRS